jgi:uncharacterized membrane protein (DUF4010 family)
MLENFVLFQKIVLSLAIGALVGIEREKRGRGELAEGLRTFMLVCLFGVLSGVFSDILQSNLPFLIAFFSVGVLTVFGYITKTRHGHLGLTTEIAFLSTFAIGIIIFFDSYPYFLSISLGILLTFVLISKEVLHRFAKQLKIKEIRDAVVFAILTFVILPMLPNRTVDPFNALNPFVIWLSIVFVLSISFAGYIAMKVFGTKRGLALTGLFGGLASSTGVAIAMAENIRKNKRILYSATFAVIIASSTMFLRMIAVSSIFNFEVGLRLALPLAILAFAGYLLSFISWKKMLREKTSLSISSPLALKSALKFGVFFTAVLFISSLAKNYLGPLGLYVVALIAGLVEVDAVTISYSSLVVLNSAISPIVAANGILIAALANTFSKWMLVNWFGSRKMGLEVGKVFAVFIALGILFLLFLTGI